jgi:erythromycin esterase-like protein
MVKFSLIKNKNKSRNKVPELVQKSTKWYKNLFKRLIIFLCVLLILGVLVGFINYFFLEIRLAPKEQANLRDEVEWLKQNTIPLASVKPVKGVKFNATDFADLQPLKHILQETKIVGLGEATHGTKQFFTMKHRLFQFLVSELGFRIFAIEYEFSDSIAINMYVLNGEGKAEEVVKNIKFWTWRTQELLDLVKWMREWNIANPSDPVRFYGFDIQTHESPIRELKKYSYKTNFISREKLEQAQAKFQALIDTFGSTNQTQTDKDFTRKLVK